jgi:hypothetical protein
MMDLFDNVWGDRHEIVVDHCLDVTLPVRHLRPAPYPYLNTSARLRFSSSVLQVIYVQFQAFYVHEGILGFGRRVTWTSDLVVPAGHQMTFKDALHILSTNLIVKLSLPGWTKNLTKHSRKVHQSFVELKVCYTKLS